MLLIALNQGMRSSSTLLRKRLKSSFKESGGNDFNFFRLTIKSIKFEN
jgi:hypothetical protein